MKNLFYFIISLIVAIMLSTTSFAREREVIDIRGLAPPEIVYDGIEKCVTNPCAETSICFKDTRVGRDRYFRTASGACEKKYKKIELQKKKAISILGGEEGEIADIFLEGGCRENPCPRGPEYICWGPGGWMSYWLAINHYCAQSLPSWMENIPDMGDPPPMAK